MVIGISLVGVIGVLVLFMNLMFSGDSESVASNTSGRISADWAVAPDTEKAAAEKVALLARAPITNTIGMKLHKTPAGTFLMGS